MDLSRITPNMRIREILALHPATGPVLRRHGVPCGGCHAARYETLGEGAQVHGLDLHRLLRDLNHAISTPLRLTTPTNPLDPTA